MRGSPPERFSGTTVGRIVVVGSLPALFSNKLVRERPHGHVTFAREPIWGTTRGVFMPAKAHSLWWVLSSNGDMGACWVAADQQCRYGCVLGGCCSAMETWVRAGWVLISNGDMGVCVCVCWMGADQ